MPDGSRVAAYDLPMRKLVVVVLIVVGACSNSDIELESYAIGDVTLVRTHCATADPVLRSDRPDALPPQGQTDTDRVTRILMESRDELLAANQGLDAVVVPRRGQVRVSTGAGLAAVEADDSMILVTIDGDGLCPVAPVDWNGVPIAFFRDGFLD